MASSVRRLLFCSARKSRSALIQLARFDCVCGCSCTVAHHELLCGDGATIDGSVIAQNVTVCGRIKGTIRAVRVKLQNGGAVEGDIFHRSLSIDENSLFEGSSRRVENPTEIPSSIDAKAPQTKDIQSPTPTSDLQRVEPTRSAWSESTVEPRP